MTLLLIGLIISLIVYAIKIALWSITSIVWIFNPDFKETELKHLKQSKLAFVLGGIEHLIIFGSVLAATIILY